MMLRRLTHILAIAMQHSHVLATTRSIFAAAGIISAAIILCSSTARSTSGKSRDVRW
ncbi:MAG: hypothetical protein ACOC0P_05035 [Planctomycetota bacterium]